ncbi:phosphoglycolate phosphatase [Methanohalophilus sp.]|uniref:phosphoglycolate phosphatase n=1 Tax=Methanohalophilus sp. TaxID=1966352 RepID=UPI002634AFAD|nr:phosphoglycolate phosphatase [Methanohalophilus sp.]MDK2891962.1 phosphoglycolate phosphatase [Methanohalophilus sp.]
MFSALAVDIDGTITGMDRKLHYGACELLYNLEIPVVLATGNVLCYASAASKLMGLEGKVISENGGVLQLAFDTKPYISDNIEECEAAFDLLSSKYDLVRLDPFLRKTEITIQRGIPVEELQEALSGSNYNVEIIDTGFAIHIKSKNVNKGTGLARMAELMEIDTKDFVAIGDSVNDIEMCEIAGFSVAVGNASDELIQVADMVTSSSFGDGAQEALEYLLAEGLIA